MKKKQINYWPPQHTKYPWLVAQFIDNKGVDAGEEQIFYNIQNPLSHYRCRIPELIGKHIRACFHGWVILFNKKYDNIMWSVWNPQTSKIIHLPSLFCDEKEILEFECCLSSPPDDPNSILLLAHLRKPNLIFCKLDRKSKKKLNWTNISYDEQLKSISGSNHCSLFCPTSYNGKIIILSYDSWKGFNFVIHVDIEVQDKKVVVNLVPLVKQPTLPEIHYCRSSCFLKGSCDDLYFIYTCVKEDEIHSVYLFKLDTNNTLWEKMEDLKDAMFIVDLSGYSPVDYSPAVSSVLRGCIHILDQKSQVINSYDVPSKTITMSPIPRTDLSPTNYVIWSLPGCRFEGDYGETKCNVESKQEEDEEFEVLVVNDERVSCFPFHILELIMKFCVNVGYLNFRATCKQLTEILRLRTYSLVWSMPGCRLEGDYGETKCNDESKIEEDNESKRVSSLPFDILELIMKLCGDVGYLNFRATCKRLAELPSVIRWRNITEIQRLRAYSLVSPWSMVLDNDRGVITVTDLILGNKYFIRTPRELFGDVQIHYSKNGWLLMSKNTSELMFFNPFTSDIRKLPHLDNRVLNGLCFSASPTSPDCMVFGITKYEQVYIHFVGREQSWHRVELEFIMKYSKKFVPLTFYGRDVYALNNETLVVFKSDDHLQRGVVSYVPYNYFNHYIEYYLTKSDQHLLLVSVDVFEKSVQVHKLNQSTLKVEKLKSLGKNVIYVSETTCLCIKATTPKMKNKVFFHESYFKNSSTILFYCLGTGRLHAFDDDNMKGSLRDLYNFKRLVHPHAWIEPGSS